MEKITTDISTFKNLRKGGYAYVDKTDLLWRLVSDVEGRQFFISRPRRFGKSLMLSTLRAIFEGKRELFRRLKITKLKNVGFDRNSIVENVGFWRFATFQNVKQMI